MKKLYFQCNSGISGDMTVAALLDLGADRAVLEKALKSLCVDGYHIHIGKVKKCGIEAMDFNVHLKDHHEEAHHHNHDDESVHLHEHSHHHEHEKIHQHPHEHRNLNDIITIIQSGDFSEHAKKLAVDIFTVVAEAESKAHGLPIEEVHFHEVGAVDSIVDIVGAAVCLDNLGVSEVYCPRYPDPDRCCGI